MSLEPDTKQVAAALYQEGFYVETLELVEPELADDPDNGRLWELRGMAEYALGNSRGAVFALETATTLVPLSRSAQCVLAKGYLSIGKKELAADIYRFLFSLFGLRADLLPHLAAGLGSVGELAMALEACRRASTLDPASAPPLMGMAYYMELLKYPPSLIANVLRKAVSLEPDSFRYRFALATACLKMNKLDEAYETMRKHVDDRQLASIRCKSCLQRLENLFAAAGDSARREACERRLREVEST
jgi:tetratricopeptide (TPR) repeat protein